MCDVTCECNRLRVSLRVNGVLFLGRAPGRCMSHTSHGETTSMQRLTAHTYKHVILELIFQTALLEIRILRLIYREISFISLNAPMISLYAV